MKGILIVDSNYSWFNFTTRKYFFSKECKWSRVATFQYPKQHSSKTSETTSRGVFREVAGQIDLLPISFLGFMSITRFHKAKNVISFSKNVNIFVVTIQILKSTQKDDMGSVEMYWKLLMKALKRRHWRLSGVFIIYFQQFQQFFLEYSLLTLKILLININNILTHVRSISGKTTDLLTNMRLVILNFR